MNKNLEQKINPNISIYLEELIKNEINPLFLRLLKSALLSEDILNEMESEMSRYLMEVLTDENK